MEEKKDAYTHLASLRLSTLSLPPLTVPVAVYHVPTKQQNDDTKIG